MTIWDILPFVSILIAVILVWYAIRYGPQIEMEDGKK